MFGLKEKNSIVLEVKDDFVDILVGNIKKIKMYDSIPIPKGLCKEGFIKDTRTLSEILLKYFLENNIEEDKISFVIFGSDVITRYIQVPYMKKENLRETVQFEIKELIPNGEDYYLDYEVVNKDNNKNNPKLDVLVAACIKKKIDAYVDLSKALNKKLDVIDVLTNTINKILVNSSLIYEGKTIAMFYLGYSFSNISISTNGIMKLERNIPFGFQNLINEYQKEVQDDKDKNLSLEKILRDISLEGYDIKEIVNKHPKIKELMDNLLAIVEKTIKFYESGKRETSVDKIEILSTLTINKAIRNYIEDYFTIKSNIIRNTEELGLEIKNSNKEFIRFLPLYGLFLRRN